MIPGITNSSDHRAVKSVGQEPDEERTGKTSADKAIEQILEARWTRRVTHDAQGECGKTHGHSADEKEKDKTGNTENGAADH